VRVWPVILLIQTFVVVRSEVEAVSLPCFLLGSFSKEELSVSPSLSLSLSLPVGLVVGATYLNSWLEEERYEREEERRKRRRERGEGERERERERERESKDLGVMVGTL
jgi:hypothetical protein